MTAAYFSRLAVIGAGAWGSALALSLARAGRRVTLLGRSDTPPQAIENSAVDYTTDWSVVVKSDALVLAVPTQNLRQVLSPLKNVTDRQQPLLIAAKGIETNTDLLPQQIAHDVGAHNPLSLISGPNFASEIIHNLPTATTISAVDEAVGQAWLTTIGHDRFRPYYSNDMIGVAVSGALKNVLAIAAGMVIGMGLGENARASVVTRGLVEITRLAVALGGQPTTMMGLAGVGDVMLTCYSEQSRNFRFGLALGRGESPAAAARLATTIEGITTAQAAMDLAKRRSVATPIIDATAAIVAGHQSVQGAIQALLSRPFKAETA